MEEFLCQGPKEWPFALTSSRPKTNIFKKVRELRKKFSFDKLDMPRSQSVRNLKLDTY